MRDTIQKWSKDRRESFFPNVERIAHFSPRAQLVTLDAYKGDELPKAIAAKNHDKAADMLATISHEYTHWADIVGTVWGRGHMQRAYEAFRLMHRRNRPGSESDFQQIIAFYDEERRLCFPKYYQTVEKYQPTYSSAPPWIIGFSAGQEIDPYGCLDPSRPILFVRFFDRETRDLLIRQPITVGALLETIAVASEHVASFNYIDSQVSEDQKIVTSAITKRAFFKRIYEPELTLYSAPTHLFAHFARVQDFMLAYKYTARIAHLCLNLTDLHLESLLLPSIMEPWTELFPAFKKRGDRGFAFAVICSNLKPWAAQQDVTAWLDAALRLSGLPEASTLMSDALVCMFEDVVKNRGFSFDTTENYMLDLGVKIAQSRKASPAFGPDYSMKVLGLVPPAVDCDGDVVQWPGSGFDFDRFDPEAMTDLDWSLEGYTRNLLTGCR